MKKVCGIDVHKDSVFMCIMNEKEEKIEEKFSTLTPDLDNYSWHSILFGTVNGRT